MKLIAHRGNLLGRISARENEPSYIEEALQADFDVEVDVWNIDGYYFLGHDSPEYPVDEKWIKKSRLWCHAKNGPALFSLEKLAVNCFWHEKDKFTMTRYGYFWTCEHEGINERSVYCHPSDNYFIPNLTHVHGICSDWPQYLKNQK